MTSPRMQKLRRTAATGASPNALLEEFAGNDCNYGSEDLKEAIASDVRRIAPGTSRPATQMMSRAQTAAVFQASQAPRVLLPLHNLVSFAIYTEFIIIKFASAHSDRPGWCVHVTWPRLLV